MSWWEVVVLFSPKPQQSYPSLVKIVMESLLPDRMDARRISQWRLGTEELVGKREFGIEALEWTCQMTKPGCLLAAGLAG